MGNAMDIKKGDFIPLLHHLIIGELYIANLKSDIV
jgi:hypothetical protein